MNESRKLRQLATDKLVDRNTLIFFLSASASCRQTFVEGQNLFPKVVLCRLFLPSSFSEGAKKSLGIRNSSWKVLYQWAHYNLELSIAFVASRMWKLYKGGPENVGGLKRRAFHWLLSYFEGWAYIWRKTSHRSTLTCSYMTYSLRPFYSFRQFLPQYIWKLWRRKVVVFAVACGDA